jgi:hypothetical protein
MQLPIKSLDSLMSMWATDAQLDETEPHKELARIPVLHAKYVRILTHHKMIVAAIEREYRIQKKFAADYYAGNLNNPDDLKEHNIEPFKRQIAKTHIPDWVDADEKLNGTLLKKAFHQQVVDACNFIIKELNNRTFQIRAIIDWEKFVGGK